MQYALLIYANEEILGQLSQAAQMAYLGAWAEYTAEMVRLGVRTGGEAFQPTMLATTVRQGDGRTLVTDGPFAETKEQLGGLYLIDVPNLDEALAWAARMPHLAYGGSTEVRPLMQYGTS